MYRTKEEVQEQYENNNPITRFTEKVIRQQLVSEADLREIDDKLEAELQDAITFAENSVFPEAEEALEDLFVGEVTLYE